MVTLSVDDIGLDLHFRPGMGENYGVAAVRSAVSNSPSAGIKK